MGNRIKLDLDQSLAWRRPKDAVRVSVAKGDMVVLTLSPNGQDAEPVHVTTATPPILIPEAFWYTIETLGTESIVTFDKDGFEDELAPVDWYPRPRSARC